MIFLNVIKIVKRFSKKKIFENKIEVILSVLSQLVLIFQLLLQNKILATYFSKTEYGMWSLFLSLYVLISMLPFTAFDQAIARITYKKVNSEEKYHFVNSIYLIFSLFFIFHFILLMLLTKSSSYNVFFWSFIIFTFTEILKNSLLVIDNASRNRKRVFLLRSLDLIARTLLLLILFKYSLFTIDGVFWVFIMVNIISILSSYKKFGKIFNYINVKYIVDLFSKDILVFSYPLMIWAIFGWLQNMINRWYLNYYLDSDSVAIYTILVSITFFLPNAIYGAINNFFMPYFYSKNIRAKISFYKKYLLNIGIILVAYTIFTFFFKEYLVLILADKKYLQIANLVPIITLTSSVYILSMISTFEIYRSGDTKKLLFPTILSGIIPTIAGYFVVDSFGLNGAIVNYILGQLVYACLVFRISYKHIKGDL